MYSAIKLAGSFYWYPTWDWDVEPNATVITTSSWDELIASFVVDRNYMPGNYTFYSAITEHDTYDLIEMDSVSITIKKAISICQMCRPDPKVIPFPN